MQAEVLKQLSSMGRLVVCAGDGAVQSSTNLYAINLSLSLPPSPSPSLSHLKPLLKICRGFLRHGISIWMDVPLDIVAKGLVEDLPSSQLSTSQSYSEVRSL